MKAAVCRIFGEPLQVENIHIAQPSRGEVRVRVKACAICHSDLICMDGGWGGELPAVFGHEAAGVVESVGPGSSHLAVGDHVVVTLIRACGECHYCEREQETQCEAEFPLDRVSPLRDQGGTALVQGLRTGAFAEQVLVEASQVCAIADDVPFAAASLLACGVLTGFGAVTNSARVPAGASIAVIGCGGVGLNSIQAAVKVGAAPIIALDPVEGKRQAAIRFGASHALDSSGSDLPARIKALTHGRGVDFVFVTVGAKVAIDQCLSLLARSGTAVIVGMPASGVMGEYDPGTFAAMGQKMIGSKMGSARIARDIPVLVELYRQGHLKLDELISGRYALDEINTAINSVRQGEALRNVIVFP